MRQLSGIDGNSPEVVLARLRLALSGEGSAILPMATGGTPPVSLGQVPRNVAVVIETSGSTGVPKRVMLGTDALLAGAAASSAALGGPGQWLLALPTHYVAGVQVLVRSIAAETLPVVLEPGHFAPAAFVAAAHRLSEPLRYTSLVPVQLARLVHAAESEADVLAVLRRFTAILVGGQAVDPELIRRAASLDIHVVRTYGSSETAGGCVYNGIPIGNTRVREAAVDGSTQLEISGAVLAEGYLGDPVLTQARFIDEHGERWFRTGDVGSVDAETGVVQVFGRADNVIISGGVKVSLDAVERAVNSLPGLGSAVVVWAPDERWGQVPVIVTVDAGHPDLPTIRDAVGAQIAKSARPDRIVVIDELPLLGSGKVNRQLLVRMLSS